MTELYQYLSQLVPMRLSPGPIDLYEPFTYEWSNRPTGSTMPPGPGVEFYTLYWVMDYDGLHYQTKIHWRSFVNWLVQNIEPWQVTHRSRLVALSANALKVNEIDHRIEQTRQNLPHLRKAALKPRQSHELYSLLNDVLLQHLKLDPLWIREYIREHETSSLGQGWKWKSAHEVTRSEWFDIIGQLRANVEQLSRSEGYYNQVRLNTGIRARSDDIPAIRSDYEGLLTRSRIIMFHPSISIMSIGMPQKANAYTKFLKGVIDILDTDMEYYFPYELGGKIYLKISDLMRQNLHFRAYDGKSWESSVGVILGESFRPWMVHIAGLDFLPSGSTVTSLLDSAAMVVATHKMHGTAVVLGDDFNYWGKQQLQVPYIEEDPADSRYRYTLGVVSRPDPLMPRISGIKATMDRARAMRPLKMKFQVPASGLITRSRDIRSMVAWAGLFKGWFGERTLLESLQQIPPGEYLAPHELIERLIEDQSVQVDPFVWAERLGIKNVFL